MKKLISNSQLYRLPVYLRTLESMQANGKISTTSKEIAKLLNLNVELVKKDLQIFAEKGKPRVRRSVSELINSLNKYLGCCQSDNAIIVGIGNIGKAIYQFNGFNKVGVNIVAGFDNNKKIVGQTLNGKQIYSMTKLSEIIRKFKVRIGIISVDVKSAQDVTNLLIENNIEAIWNFTPTHLIVPNNIIVQNVDLASELAILTLKLKNKYMENK